MDGCVLKSLISYASGSGALFFLLQGQRQLVFLFVFTIFKLEQVDGICLLFIFILP